MPCYLLVKCIPMERLAEMSFPFYYGFNKAINCAHLLVDSQMCDEVIGGDVFGYSVQRQDIMQHWNLVSTVNCVQVGSFPLAVFYCFMPRLLSQGSPVVTFSCLAIFVQYEELRFHWTVIYKVCICQQREQYITCWG